MQNIRVAVFDQWMPIHYLRDLPEPTVDDPSDWAASLGGLKFTEFWEGPYGERECKVDDPRLETELKRLTTFKTCPICRSATSSLPGLLQRESIQVCLKCGYWGGIGFRDWNSHQHPHPRRGVIGRYRPLEPLSAQATEYLVSHLRRYPEQLPKISSGRAEGFVMDLLSDYLNCETRVLGGVKDGGVDGYVLRGNDVRSIVQIKWHESTSKAESVRVVREVAGTLLARNIPSGILVSNKRKFSPSAEKEANEISKLSIEGLGRINLELMDYENLLDMLEITNTKLTETMEMSDWFTIDTREECVFDGAARISERLARNYME